MSKEIARVSHDLARDLQLLSSKAFEEGVDSSVVTCSSGQTSPSTLVPSEYDSLDTTDNALHVSSPAALFSDKIPRKTWNSAAIALDSLMLSNVCALSSRYYNLHM